MRILTDALQGIDLRQPLPEGVKLAVSYLRVSSTAQVDTDFNDEGLSIPAQREANERTAQRLGAVIVAEFADKGESARTADRPELQAMLQFVRELGIISYVIVHKVDRLARSREDDVVITIAIRQAGAQLVSSTENIDETPSGKLLHGIMATIAEFYSANLASESKKGMRQKVRAGGTIGLAPLGYRNVGIKVDGREVRTVILDPDRAPLIEWMFNAYASGDWTMRQLAEELEGRGLHIPATRRQPSRPVSIQQIDKMLMNRYYLGFVKFEGVWYEGRHPAIVDQVTFDRAQAVRLARALSREKTQKHPHYLKGSVFCGRCQRRLGVMNARNRWGAVYPYFYCLGRAKQKDCDQKAVLITDVEASVADYWRRVQLSEAHVAALRQRTMTELGRRQRGNQTELQRQEKRRKALQDQQLKLIEARYADAIPLDLLKSEQDRIVRELAGVEQVIARCSAEISVVLEVLDDVLLLCSDAHQLYLSAPPEVRRQLNQAVFVRFWVASDQVESADLAEPFADLLAHRAEDPEHPKAPLPGETTNPGPVRDRGSDIPTVGSLMRSNLNPGLRRYIRSHAAHR